MISVEKINIWIVYLKERLGGQVSVESGKKEKAGYVSPYMVALYGAPFTSRKLSMYVPLLFLITHIPCQGHNAFIVKLINNASIYV